MLDYLQQLVSTMLVLPFGVDVSERSVNMILNGQNPTGDPDVNDIVPKAELVDGTLPPPHLRLCRTVT